MKGQRLILLLIPLWLQACDGGKRSAEGQFFELNLAERAVRLDAMETREIYKLYRYEAGSTPATSETAIALGRKGEKSYDILIADLESRTNLIHPSDYLPILVAQCAESEFCVCSDLPKLKRLNRAILRPGMRTEIPLSTHLADICRNVKELSAGNEMS